jgi:hypothetical protein
LTKDFIAKLCMLVSCVPYMSPTMLKSGCSLYVVKHVSSPGVTVSSLLRMTLEGMITRPRFGPAVGRAGSRRGRGSSNGVSNQLRGRSSDN